jgi:hypothetical protein
MLRRGVEIFQSTPIALRGEHLSPVLQHRLIAELFIADGGAVGVWMACDFDEGFEISDVNVGDTTPISEGETLLF